MSCKDSTCNAHPYTILSEDTDIVKVKLASTTIRFYTNLYMTMTNSILIPLKDLNLVASNETPESCRN